jgi:hypothetical protein
MGNAVWEPDDGQVDGALQFDGMDVYINAPHILDPAEGVFSVFAWTKGGAPGQVIIAQNAGTNWLRVDPVAGCLMSELKPVRRGQPLVSSAAITDGNWHRVGFTWDGANRRLYVDDVVVAEDSQSNLTGASGPFHIGVASNLEEGTFWSGLIDDVRVYNRVVVP